jgi:CRISPR/Cas system-associated endonuclease/helicase Cas3
LNDYKPWKDYDSRKKFLKKHDFDNLGKDFPDEVVSSWIDEDGNYRAIPRDGRKSKDKHHYYSIDHYNTLDGQIADDIQLDLTKEEGRDYGGYNSELHEYPDDNDVNEMLNKTKLIRIQNHIANTHPNFAHHNMIGVEIANPPTTSQLKTLRNLEKTEGKLIDFNVGRQGRFDSGEGWKELRKTLGEKKFE